MARTSPLLPLHEQAQALVQPYGESVAVVGTYGELELEYAAIRKHCGLMDLPQRGVIEVRGPDRLEFLNRMLTQELKGMAEGEVRRSFWLNRKGRIDADLRVINLADRMLFDVDVHAAARTVETLGAFIITEDVTLTDRTDATHRLSLHGKTATALMASVTGADAPGVGIARGVSIAGHACTVFRDDTAGEPGYELIVEAEHAEAVYRRLVEVGHDASHGAAALRPAGDAVAQATRLRPIGWHAYNIARIEAGTPLFNIDFGPENLPAESGVLHERVSFKKGCYLGQEVVARMYSRGQFKQVLVAVKFAAAATPEEFAFQPAGGAALHPVKDGVMEAAAVGGITSSTISPMLGSVAIAFAQVRSGHHGAGTVLATMVDGREVRGVVQESLVFVRGGA